MKIFKIEEDKDIKTKNVKMFLYGKSFIGKTYLSASFPKPFIVSTDGNVKGLGAVNKDIQVVILNDWQTKTTKSGLETQESGWVWLRDNIDKIIASDRKTIIIDIIKDVYDFCRSYVLSREGIIHESEMKTPGKIWKLLDAEFDPWLRKLMTSNKNVILIAHEKEQRNSKGEIIGMTPNTISTVSQKLQSYVDINARYISNTDLTSGSYTRTLYTIPSIGFDSGNRLGIKTIINEPNYNKIIKEIRKGE